jgi:hypothetical protein
MGTIGHKTPLNDEQIARYLNGDDPNKIVNDVACQSSYHPAGYDIFSERIEQEGDTLFAIWNSWDSCD